MLVLARGQQDGHHSPQRGRGHSEADALGPLLDGRIDADNLAARVQKRPAGVAGIDGRIGLDDVEDVVATVGFQRPAEGTDHSRRQRPVEAERVADGDGPLADAYIISGGHGQRLHRRRAGIDVQHGQVVAWVYAHHLGLHLPVIGEDDFDFVGIGDDVVVGHNVAGVVPYEAGASALARHGAEEEVHRHDFRGDMDHRRPDALVEVGHQLLLDVDGPQVAIGQGCWRGHDDDGRR